jgi:hypothetical protein
MIIYHLIVLTGYFCKKKAKRLKVGGLDVETNRDRDRERPTCRDELF